MDSRPDVFVRCEQVQIERSSTTEPSHLVKYEHPGVLESLGVDRPLKFHPHKEPELNNWNWNITHSIHLLDSTCSSWNDMTQTWRPLFLRRLAWNSLYKKLAATRTSRKFDTIKTKPTNRLPNSRWLFFWVHLSQDPCFRSFTFLWVTRLSKAIDQSSCSPANFKKVSCRHNLEGTYALLFAVFWVHKIPLIHRWIIGLNLSHSIPLQWGPQDVFGIWKSW